MSIGRKRILYALIFLAVSLRCMDGAQAPPATPPPPPAATLVVPIGSITPTAVATSPFPPKPTTPGAFTPLQTMVNGSPVALFPHGVPLPPFTFTVDSNRVIQVVPMIVVPVEFIICARPLQKWSCTDSGKRWKTFLITQ